MRLEHEDVAEDTEDLFGEMPPDSEHDWTVWLILIVVLLLIPLSLM